MKENEINFGYIQITRKCNNNCLICSNPPSEKGLSLKEVKSQINKYIENGINCIILTGGEPSLSNLLIPTINYCSERKIEVKMITNGRWLKDKNFCMALKKSGLSDVNISFNSHLKSIFEKITRTRGSYLETLEGINNCLQYIGVPSFNLVITSLNYKTLSMTVKFLARKFPQVNHFSINYIDPVGRAFEHTDLVPSYSEAELWIYRLLATLVSLGKTFRLERVPLCYMQGFECFSTEAIRAILHQQFNIYFLDRRGLKAVNQESLEKEYIKTDSCSYCLIKDICPGINKNYSSIHHINETFPFFGQEKVQEIINKVANLR